MNVWNYEIYECEFHQFWSQSKWANRGSYHKGTGAILKLLVEHHGQVLSRAQILDHVWAAHEDPPFDRVVDVYIKQLRKNLLLDCIVTVKNVGYKLELRWEN